MALGLMESRLMRLHCSCFVLDLCRTELSVYTGIDEKELTRLEMASILCFGDKPHSQIMESMPERSGITAQKELFEPTLAEVSRVLNNKNSIPERSGITAQKELFEPTLAEVSRVFNNKNTLSGVIFFSFKVEFCYLPCVRF
jgi:hypothetical protein